MRQVAFTLGLVVEEVLFAVDRWASVCVVVVPGVGADAVVLLALVLKVDVVCGPLELLGLRGLLHFLALLFLGAGHVEGPAETLGRGVLSNQLWRVAFDHTNFKSRIIVVLLLYLHVLHSNPRHHRADVGWRATLVT